MGQNIRTEQQAGRPHDQAVAIAMNQKDQAGGKKPAKKKGPNPLVAKLTQG